MKDGDGGARFTPTPRNGAAAGSAAAGNDSVSVAYMTLTFNKEPDVLFLCPASPRGQSSFVTSASEIEVLRLSFLPRGFGSAQL